MNIQNVRKLTLLAAVMIGAAACAKDPGAGKAAAEVKPAEAEKKPAEPAAGEKTEKLAVNGQNGTVAFVGAKVTAQHPGTFSDFDGTITLVNEDPAKSSVDLTVKMDSLKSDENLDKLVGHLKSPDFFDTAKFPTATFTSTEIKKEAAGYTVTGNLQLRDVKKSVTFPAAIDLAADSVTVKAEFSINRKDFGIVYAGMADDLIKDNVLIKLDLKAKRGS